MMEKHHKLALQCVLLQFIPVEVQETMQGGLMFKKQEFRKRGTQRGSGSGGRKFGLHNYSADEVEKLLDILEEVTPIGASHWEQIGEIFEA